MLVQVPFIPFPQMMHKYVLQQAVPHVRGKRRGVTSKKVPATHSFCKLSSVKTPATQLIGSSKLLFSPNTVNDLQSIPFLSWPVECSEAFTTPQWAGQGWHFGNISKPNYLPALLCHGSEWVYTDLYSFLAGTSLGGPKRVC